MRTSDPRRADLPVAAVVIGQLAVAAVWVYEGLVAKILGLRSDEAAIVASIPFLPDGWARAGVVVLGAYELLLALWVLIGRAPVVAAVVQTLTLIGFNVGGLVFGGGAIDEPAHLLITNAAYLVLAWLVALGRRSLRRRTPA